VSATAESSRDQGEASAEARAVLADLAYGGLAFSLSAACCSSLWEVATSHSTGLRGGLAQLLLAVGRPATAIVFAACGLFFVVCAGWTAGAMRATAPGGEGQRGRS
jgi:hypothetical protein